MPRGKRMKCSKDRGWGSRFDEYMRRITNKNILKTESIIQSKSYKTCKEKGIRRWGGRGMRHCDFFLGPQSLHAACYMYGIQGQ